MLDLIAELEGLSTDFLALEKLALARQRELSADASFEDREAAYVRLLAGTAHEDPRVGACFAVNAGVLLDADDRLDAVKLNAAIFKKILTVFVNALTFCVECYALPHEPDAEDRIRVRDRYITVASEESVKARLPKEWEAWACLDWWCRAAIAAWSRRPPFLQMLAEKRENRVYDLVELLGRFREPALRLNILMSALRDAPLVVLLPELGEGWHVRVTGCPSLGALQVLLSEALAEPLSRLGISPASPALADVMRGDGPQAIDETFVTRMRVYSWRAINPEDGFPRDGVFTWRTATEVGSHGLPEELVTADIDRLEDDTRVIAIVSDKAPYGTPRVRVIKAARLFIGLRSYVTDERRLDDEELAYWKSAIAARTLS